MAPATATAAVDIRPCARWSGVRVWRRSSNSSSISSCCRRCAVLRSGGDGSGGRPGDEEVRHAQQRGAAVGRWDEVRRVIERFCRKYARRDLPPISAHVQRAGSVVGTVNLYLAGTGGGRRRILPPISANFLTVQCTVFLLTVPAAAGKYDHAARHVDLGLPEIPLEGQRRIRPSEGPKHGSAPLARAIIAQRCFTRS